MLPQENVQDDTVDLVVYPVIGQHANGGLLLSISIDAMVQKEPGEGEEQVDIIMLTHRTVEKHINTAISRIERLPTNAGKVTRIRLEELAA